MPLLKKLTPIGNSLGLIMDRPILELLGIDRETPLELSTDGEGLYIRPIRREYLDRVRETAATVMRVHGKTLKKLAG